jgi:hypothetical protein
MAQWKSDEELFGWMRKELSTPPVSDVMEQLGFRYPMLPAHIRPLRSDMVLIGRAMPVQDVDGRAWNCGPDYRNPAVGQAIRIFRS